MFRVLKLTIILAMCTSTAYAWSCTQSCPSSVFSGKFECIAYQKSWKCKKKSKKKASVRKVQRKKDIDIPNGGRLSVGANSDVKVDKKKNRNLKVIKMKRYKKIRKPSGALSIGY